MFGLMLWGYFVSHRTHWLFMIKVLWWRILVIFLWVYLILQPKRLIFSGCLLIWLRRQSRNVWYYVDGMCVLSIGDFIIFCCNFLEAPRLICSLLYEMVHQWGHDAIWRGVCHDLKEILRVTNFLLYLSNMIATIVAQELRF